MGGEAGKVVQWLKCFLKCARSSDWILGIHVSQLGVEKHWPSCPADTVGFDLSVQ